VSRLEAFVAVGWTWDAVIDQWEIGFAHLEAFVVDKGHARVPQDFKTADGYPLGAWVGSQRAAHRDATLMADRAALLEAFVVSGWTWAARADQWEKGFAHLEAFVADTGDARVPAKFKTADGYPLGAWVSKQRRRRSAGELGAERVARLEALDGWAWRAK
jgi:hypothetical protein